jgi:hypothetical protein
VAVRNITGGSLGRTVDWRVDVPLAPPMWRASRKAANAALLAKLVATSRWRSPAPPSLSYPKLFVVGCGRSGTTWVQDMLAGAPQVASTQESHVYDSLYGPVVRHGGRDPRGWLKVLQRYDLGRREQRWVGLYWWVTKRQLVDIAGEALAAHDMSTEQIARRAVGRVFDCWFEGSAGPATVLLEKTPSHIGSADVILESFPEAKIIEVVRDARDVCVSLEKQALTLGWPPRDRAAQVRTWRRAVERGLALHADPRSASRTLRVRYEDIHARPVAELTRMFSFAGLDVDTATVESIVASNRIMKYKDRADGRHRRKGIVGDWKNSLTGDDVALIEGEVGELMARLGYATG